MTVISMSDRSELLTVQKLPVSYIDTVAKLEQLIKHLRRSRLVALDTEFTRDKTYLPRLQLLQLATNSRLALVDPLVLSDLSALWRVLQRRTLTKIFHAGRQDLELINLHCGAIPTPLFDTQTAALLLGYGHQIGYGALVAAECGVSLAKAYTCTDWSLRPLKEGQLEYAVDDVRYLLPLYRRLSKRLKQAGQLVWLQEDFAALADSNLYITCPSEAWNKIKGSTALKGRQLTALKLLAAWREGKARARDLPKRWIVSDEVLLELACGAERNISDQLTGLDSKLVFYRAELQAILQSVAEEPVTDEIAIKTPLTGQQEALIDCFMAIIRLQGSSYNISPPLIANRKDLEALVRGAKDRPLLRGWRWSVAGQAVMDFLHGNLVLKALNGDLVTEPAC